MDPSVLTSGAATATAHNLSVWGLFMAADIVVKAVMLMLFAASVWCWAIIFEKIVKLRKLNAQAADFEESFWSGGSLEKLYEDVGKQPNDPMAATFAAGMREWRHASERALNASGIKAGLQQRVERVMSVTIGRELARAERYMSFLATVGSTAPFVGLFGTVWGIMNSFTSIAASNNTSLAVVAPGIAEALFATALGLVAAIPAVVAYNKFSTDLGRYADRLDAFSSEFSSILSRYLEERV
jgi:biopolymer transport protein TolQ